MRDPQSCPNWDGNVEGCDCSWCITEAMEESMGVGGDDDFDDDDEWPDKLPTDPTPGPNGCTCGFNGDCNCPFKE